jgi:hypothetical protein
LDDSSPGGKPGRLRHSSTAQVGFVQPTRLVTAAEDPFGTELVSKPPLVSRLTGAGGGDVVVVVVDVEVVVDVVVGGVVVVVVVVGAVVDVVVVVGGGAGAPATLIRTVLASDGTPSSLMAKIM